MGQMNYINQPSMGMMPNQGRMSPNMMGSIRTAPMGTNAGIYGAQPMGSMMAARPMTSSQGFSSNSFTSYKGIS